MKLFSVLVMTGASLASIGINVVMAGVNIYYTVKLEKELAKKAKPVHLHL